MYGPYRVNVTVDPPTFCLVALFKVESKELELELELMYGPHRVTVFLDMLTISSHYSF